MKNTNRKNKQWLENKNQIANPKIFNVKMIRNPDGTFHVLGGETMVLDRKNQHRAEWVKVDTRDFTRVLRSSNITSF